jgi:hypothetical protein
MAVAKTRPTGNADGTSVVLPTRTGKYGEAYNFPMGLGRYGWADEGSYYTVASVIGTDITAHAAPAIADTETKPLIHMFNGGSNDIYLDYIEMLTTIANASATAVAFRAYTDAKGATGRTGAGTALTPVNTRSNATNTSGATVFAGAVTAVGTSPKLVYSRVIKEFIGVALDRYSFSFGNGLVGNPTTSYTAGATAIVCYGPPIIIAPGGNLYFCQVSPSGAATAATFQFEMGFAER